MTLSIEAPTIVTNALGYIVDAGCYREELTALPIPLVFDVPAICVVDGAILRFSTGVNPPLFAVP